MQTIVGYVLILLGIVWIVLSVLVWLGVIHPAGAKAILAATGWDVLIELIRKLPWLAVVGLIQIYAGLKMIGVKLPF
jgi:hypothetical protein